MPDVERPSDEVLRRFAEHSLTLTTDDERGSTTIPYRLMSPDPEPSEASYPLVVFLHGAGERGSDNRAPLKYLPEVLAREENRHRFRCYVAAPQCPAGATWHTWPPKAQELQRLGPETLPASLTADLVREAASRCAVDVRRVYLTGLSMGGFGAWYAAARDPGLFAALAPICGGGRLPDAGRLRTLPIWAVHGACDDVVPPDYGRNIIEAVRRAGGTPRYDELPGVGHDSWTPAYEPAFGLLDWLFAQTRST